MADGIKGKIEEAGHSIAETAKRAGNRASEAAEQATDWAKEKAHQVSNRAGEVAQQAKHAVQERFGGGGNAAAEVRERMDVVGSCGNKLGVVDHVEGDAIKLTRSDSPDGQHHLIPTSWVQSVDDKVHLSKDCGAARAEWK